MNLKTDLVELQFLAANKKQRNPILSVNSKFQDF